MKGHLLLVGKEPQRLFQLSLWLSRCFNTVTISITDDPLQCAEEAIAESFDNVLACLDGDEATAGLQRLLASEVGLICLAPASSAAYRLVQAAGGMVMASDVELQASLLAASLPATQPVLDR